MLACAQTDLATEMVLCVASRAWPAQQLDFLLCPRIPLRCERRQVAIKKIKMGGVAEAMDGIPRDAIKEIKFLQEVKHENVCEVSALSFTPARALSPSIPPSSLLGPQHHGITSHT
jgi:hypothetical protein